MKVAGIIAEYNPFHGGHQYHIEETKKKTGADYLVIIMSGNFVQRGQPALVDKYLRAQMALKGGADLVIEMPSLYATASAEFFATAGVKILDEMKCIDFLSFGSEWADIESLSHVAQILLEEPDDYKRILKKQLEAGNNYPKAREAALYAWCGEEKYRTILEMPNHILGVEYLKALARTKSPIQPIAITRKGSGYHAKEWNEMENAYPSATAIRNLLKEERKVSVLQKAVPYQVDGLVDLLENGDRVEWSDLMPILDYLIVMNRGNLDSFWGVEPDLARRISNLYEAGKSFEEIIDICHSKNYTDAALRRVFLHIVLGFLKKDYLEKAGDIPVPYAKVLGFRKDAGKLIRMIKENSAIPIILKAGDGSQLMEDKIANEIYETDLRVSNLYEQMAAAKAKRKAREEILRHRIII